MDDLLSTELIRPFQNIDDAAVAQETNRQLRNASDGRVVVQRRLQRLANKGEKLLFLDVSLLGGDVVADNQIADGVSLGVVPPRDREPREKL